jgi:CubicO group peptidase (beta-lactamase class C family)
MKKVFFLLPLFILMLFFSNCQKDQPPLSKTELLELLEEELEDQNIAGLSLIVTKNNNILVEEYLGDADKSLNTAVTATTKFLLASISKTVTATALMQLYEKDSFKLDDPVNNYLPFSVSPPNSTTPITFRMLLEHQSSIADGSALDNEYFWGQDSPKDLGVFLQEYFTPGTTSYNATENFTGEEPGTRHAYSNVGTALVGYLVARISGMDFDVYCQNNIFQPLCMRSSSWRLNSLDTSSIAQPYDYSNGNFNPIGHYTFTDYPNGGLRTTTRDLTRFMLAYQQQGQFNGQRLLKATTIDQMLTEHLVDGENGVGWHWFTYDRQDRNIWGHDGGEEGTTTMMGFNKSTGVGVVILCNGTDVDLDYLLEEAYDYGTNTSSTGTALGC